MTTLWHSMVTAAALAVMIAGPSSASAEACAESSGRSFERELRLAAPSSQGGYRLIMEGDGGTGSHSQPVALSFVGEDAPARPGSLYHTVDAEPFRGGRVRVRACLRTSGESAPLSGIWVRVDRPGGHGFFENMAGSPYAGTTWRAVEIVGDVADDATSITFGALRFGQGTIWIEHLVLEPVEHE